MGTFYFVVVWGQLSKKRLALEDPKRVCGIGPVHDEVFTSSAGFVS